MKVQYFDTQNIFACDEAWKREVYILYNNAIKSKKGHFSNGINLTMKRHPRFDFIAKHKYEDRSALFRAQEPTAPVTYCDHAFPASVRPSSVRPSVVRRPLDYLHFRLLLQNRLMDFDETWYG